MFYVTSIHQNGHTRNRSAIAAPTAMVWPCPSGPEVFSIPLFTSSSGCPGVVTSPLPEIFKIIKGEISGKGKN